MRGREAKWKNRGGRDEGKGKEGVKEKGKKG